MSSRSRDGPPTPARTVQTRCTSRFLRASIERRRSSKSESSEGAQRSSFAAARRAAARQFFSSTPSSSAIRRLEISSISPSHRVVSATARRRSARRALSPSAFDASWSTMAPREARRGPPYIKRKPYRHRCAPTPALPPPCASSYLRAAAAADDPARRPESHAHAKLKPPQSASISSASPHAKTPGAPAPASSSVSRSTASNGIPPCRTCAACSPAVPATVSSMPFAARASVSGVTRADVRSATSRTRLPTRRSRTPSNQASASFAPARAPRKSARRSNAAASFSSSISGKRSSAISSPGRMRRDRLKAAMPEMPYGRKRASPASRHAGPSGPRSVSAA